jgi:uncharacterized membrane protein
MNFLLSLILQTLGFAVVTTLLAFIVERAFIASGLTRGNTIWLIATTFILVTLLHLAYPDSSISLLFIGFIGALSMNRYDLTMTMKLGKWWWKKENQSQIQNLKS